VLEFLFNGGLGNSVGFFFHFFSYQNFGEIQPQKIAKAVEFTLEK
jgi:hypothetical protein